MQEPQDVREDNFWVQWLFPGSNPERILLSPVTVSHSHPTMLIIVLVK